MPRKLRIEVVGTTVSAFAEAPGEELALGVFPGGLDQLKEIFQLLGEPVAVDRDGPRTTMRWKLGQQGPFADGSGAFAPRPTDDDDASG